jgi:hypothetical protein
MTTDRAAFLALAERLIVAVERLADAGETIAAARPLAADEAEALADFLAAVHQAVGEIPWRAGALLDRATKESTPEWRDVFDAIVNLGVDPERVNAPVTLGRKLQTLAVRTDRLERAGEERGSALWRVAGVRG